MRVPQPSDWLAWGAWDGVALSVLLVAIAVSLSLARRLSATTGEDGPRRTATALMLVFYAAAAAALVHWLPVALAGNERPGVWAAAFIIIAPLSVYYTMRDIRRHLTSGGRAAGHREARPMDRAARRRQEREERRRDRH